MFLVRRMRWHSVALRSSTSPLSLALLASSRIFFRHAFLPWETEGDRRFEKKLTTVTDPISLLVARSRLSYFSLANVTGYCSPRPGFLTYIVLKVPNMGGIYFDFSEEQTRRKGLPKKLLHFRKRVSHVFCHAFQKGPFRLDCTNHHGVTLLGLSPRRFGYCTNVFLPMRRSIFYPIMFGFIIPNKTFIQRVPVNTLNLLRKPNSFLSAVLFRCTNRTLFEVLG